MSSGRGEKVEVKRENQWGHKNLKIVVIKLLRL